MNLFTQPFVPMSVQKHICTCPVISSTDCTCLKQTLFGTLQSSDCPIHTLPKPVMEDCLIHGKY